jgi:hypothetical protein
MDVQESKVVLVLVDVVRGQFSLEYFAEDAGWVRGHIQSTALLFD